MKRFASPGMLAALVAANVALVFALVASQSAPKAHAALGGGGASYVLQVGQNIGLPQETVYLVDTDSGRTAAVSVNLSTKKIDLYGARDISKDLNGKGGTTK